jgi:hypothetical protein
MDAAPPVPALPPVRERLRTKSRKEWWQKVADSGLSSSPASPMSEREGSSREAKSRIKVINLIDLVSDEDFPKLYQVPLAATPPH